jgi:hypothetical protein
MFGMPYKSVPSFLVSTQLLNTTRRQAPLPNVGGRYFVMVWGQCKIGHINWHAPCLPYMPALYRPEPIKSPLAYSPGPIAPLTPAVICPVVVERLS